MLGILCVDLDDEAVHLIQAMTNAKVVAVSRTASSRRFIYLAEILRRTIQLSKQHFVIVNTNWVKELAEAEEDFIAGARALDRVFLRFGAVNLISYPSYQKAVLKMGSLQSPRTDILFHTDQRSLKVAISAATRRRALQVDFALDTELNNLSGSPVAKAVLVGEKINPYLEFSHWPWFDDRDSAKFISHALEKANVLESDLCWTNAIHTNESLVILKLLTYRPALNVVALGNVAHEKLTELGIDHRRVSHPQHARRFDAHGNYHVVLEQAIRG